MRVMLLYALNIIDYSCNWCCKYASCPDPIFNFNRRGQTRILIILISVGYCSRCAKVKIRTNRLPQSMLSVHQGRENSYREHRPWWYDNRRILLRKILIVSLQTDLLKENQKIILGLVWSLIRHYQINKGLKGLQSSEDPVLESMLAAPSTQPQPVKPPIKKWTRVKVDPPPPPPIPPPPPPANFYTTAYDEDNPPPPPPPPPLPPYVVFEEVEVVTVAPTVTPTPIVNTTAKTPTAATAKKNDKSGDSTRTVLLREVQRRLAPDHTDLVVNDFSSRYVAL